MKQRFGALLCLALGAVLIATGLNAGSAGTVGFTAPDCGTPTPGVTVPCPTGTIAITETTVPASATPPAGGWIVHITSTNCVDPANNAVDMTLTIADGSTATSDPLFVFQNPSHATSCSYALAEDPVAGFTAAFDPASPVTIPFSGGADNNGLKVNLTNTFTPAPSTPAPSTRVSSTSAAPSSSAPTTPSASVSPIVAVTGPHEQVRATAYIGVGLCVLGLVLLLAGRGQRRRSRHAEP
jgi:hypothetical protein